MVFRPSGRRQFLKLSGAAVGVAGLSVVSQPVVGKAPNARFSLEFSDAADVADVTASSAGWQVDRRAPEAWTVDSGRLCIDIDETTETSGFYAYQGKKYLDTDGEYWYAGAGSRLSYRLYVDPSWESDGVGQQTGVWPTLGTDAGAISAYPILAYEDSDASDDDEARFKTYVYESDDDGSFTEATWVDLGLPKGFDPAEGGWVDVEAQLQQTSEGVALKWRLDNRLVVDERGYNVFAPSAQFLEFIVNSANYGVGQQYYYDDFVLTEPGTAGGGKSN